MANVTLRWIPLGKWTGEIFHLFFLFNRAAKSKHETVVELNANAHNFGVPNIVIPLILDNY